MLPSTSPQWQSAATPPDAVSESRRLSSTLDERIERRVADLTSYQSARYARRYAALVRRVREVEAERAPGHTELTEAVARCYYKLLAYKDKYQVARLFTKTGFIERIGAMFEGDYKLVFHLAPPLWTKPDSVTGEPRKRAYSGQRMLRAFRTLARMRSVRGSILDPFRYSEDRKADRRLIAEYERLIEEVTAALDPNNHATVVELASIPDAIRGYGPIRKRHTEHAKAQEAQLLAKLRGKPEQKSEGGTKLPDASSRVVMAG